MGMHSRRRKVQRAGAEVCRQGRGVRACLLRCLMTHHDGQVGRDQRGRVRLDGQRAQEMITPD